MNLLKLDIKKGPESTENELWLDLKIDGKEFLAWIDNKLNAASLGELEMSLTGDGAYLIFTCSCGVADCGGWKKVNVNHKKNRVIWKFDYNNEQFSFEFDSQFYREEIQRMIFEVKQKNLNLQPEFLVDPE